MPRRKFKRPLGDRRYRKFFFIATEGIKTEPQYFAIFNDQQSLIRVTCLKGRNDSSPRHVLNRMEKHIEKSGLKQSDEAWLIVDKDNWTDDQLSQLHQWSLSADNFGFALSNPNFEYWLLLHFEEGNGIANARECIVRLNGHLPGYDKSIDQQKFSRDIVDAAVGRARLRDNFSDEGWPRATGSTVYKLIENIIREE